MINHKIELPNNVLVNVPSPTYSCYLPVPTPKEVWMRRSVLLLAMFAFTAIDTMAEDRPNFTGTWKASPAGDGTTVSLGSGWGESFTLLQGADTLILERVFYARNDLQPAMKFRFALDGSETKNTVLLGRGEQIQVSTTAWDSDKLVITTVYHVLDAGDGRKLTSKVTQTLSFQPPRFGRSAWPPSLVIETARSGALGGPPSTTRTVYQRN